MTNTLAYLLPRAAVVSQNSRIGKLASGRPYVSFIDGQSAEWTIPSLGLFQNGTVSLVVQYTTDATDGSVSLEASIEAVSTADSPINTLVSYGTPADEEQTLSGNVWSLRSLQIAFTDLDGLALGDLVRVKISYSGSATIYVLGCSLVESLTTFAIDGGLSLGTPLPIESGGTGASDRATAINNLCPPQEGENHKFLKTDGSGEISWSLPDLNHLVPAQDGNSGKALLTNGDSVEWGLPSANSILPSQSGQANKFLKSDGTNTGWDNVPTTSPGGSTGNIQFNSSGSFAGASGFNWDNTDGCLSIGNAASTENWEKIVASSTESVGIGTRIVCENRATSGFSISVFEMRTGTSPTTDGIFFGTKNAIPNYGIHPGMTMRPMGSNSDLALASNGANSGSASGATIVIKSDYKVGVGDNSLNVGDQNGVDGQMHIIPVSTTVPDLVLQARSSQTADLLQAHDSSGSTIARIKVDGSIQPATLADGSATNNSIYYSSTAGKLVFKDGSGSVHDLY